MTLSREYTTVAAVKQQKMPNNVSIQDDALILKMIRDVSARIDTLTGFFFYPLVETRYYDALRDVDGYQLLLDRRLCAITSVTNAGANVMTPVTSNQYVTDPRNQTPYYGLTLLRSSGIVWYFNVDPENAISVTGTWSYHTRYAEAWQVLTTLGADATINAISLTFNWSALTTLGLAIADAVTTSITFASAVGAIGDTIKIDNEQMYISDRSGITATVIRGFNGTTAASHLVNATVSIGVGDPGAILKIGTEILYLSARANVTATVTRAVNGSVAAAHTTGDTVYVWSPQEGIEQLARKATVLEIIMRNDPTAIQVNLDGQVISVPKDIDGFLTEGLRALGFAVK